MLISDDFLIIYAFLVICRNYCNYEVEHYDKHEKCLCEPGCPNEKYIDISVQCMA